MSLIELYTVGVVHLAALPAIAYPLIYRRVPWKKGPTGKALMNKARSVALLFAVAIVGFWWPFPGYEYIYAAVVTYLGVAITYQFKVMLCLRRRMTLRHLEELERRTHPVAPDGLPPTHERL